MARGFSRRGRSPGGIRPGGAAPAGAARAAIATHPGRASGIDARGRAPCHRATNRRTPGGCFRWRLSTSIAPTRPSWRGSPASERGSPSASWRSASGVAASNRPTALRCVLGMGPKKLAAHPPLHHRERLSGGSQAAPLMPLAAAFRRRHRRWRWWSPPWARGLHALGAAACACPRFASRFSRRAGRQRIGTWGCSFPSSPGWWRGARRGARLPAEHVARSSARPRWTLVNVEARIAEEPAVGAGSPPTVARRGRAYRASGGRPPGASGHDLRREAPALGEGQRIAADPAPSPVGFRKPGGFDYPAQLRREGVALVGSGRADRVRPLTAEPRPGRRG